MSDNCLLMEAMDYVDDSYLKKYFDMKEMLLNGEKKKSSVNILRLKRILAVAATFLIVSLCAVVLWVNNTSNDLPEKPDMNAVIWLEGGAGVMPDESADVYKIGLLQVSEQLYKAVNENEEGYYCILVKTNGEKPADVLKLFQSAGIYAETVGENLFIFPTENDLLNLKLTTEQADSWFFALSSEAYFTNGSGVFAVTTASASGDTGEWQDVNPQKFGIYAGTTANAEFGSVAELKQAYDKLFVDIGWDPKADISIQCFISDTGFSGMDFDYLEYENLSFEKYPDRAVLIVRLSDLGVDEIRALSEDKRVSKIYISLVQNATDAES